jgi:MoxR-like ATPase
VIEEVVGKDELMGIIGQVEEVSVSKDIIEYLTTIAIESRKETRLSLGASPRAMVHLTHCARAVAFLDGRDYVTPEDIKDVAVCVLGHRVRLDDSSVLIGGVANPDQVVLDIFSRVKPPR